MELSTYKNWKQNNKHQFCLLCLSKQLCRCGCFGKRKNFQQEPRMLWWFLWVYFQRSEKNIQVTTWELRNINSYINNRARGQQMNQLNLEISWNFIYSFKKIRHGENGLSQNWSICPWSGAIEENEDIKINILFCFIYQNEGDFY